MLISIKIKKTIETEIKNQKALLKLLVSQEQNYNVDLSEQKKDIEKSIEYYESVIKNA